MEVKFEDDAKGHVVRLGPWMLAFSDDDVNSVAWPEIRKGLLDNIRDLAECELEREVATVRRT